MFFKIQTDNGVPVYEQVVRQIIFAVAGGALRPGERIPSVRQLARQLAINPNTVARAFRQLQDQKVIESVRGTGMQVRQDAVAICRQSRVDVVTRRLAGAIDEARQSQLSDGQIRQIVERELGESRNETGGAKGKG